MIIDDSFLTMEEQSLVKEIILKNASWKFVDKTAVHREEFPNQMIIDKNTKDVFQFNHMLRNENYIYSDLYDFINNEVFVKFIQKNNIVCNQIIRSKFNILTKNDNDSYQIPHVDQTPNHNVFLYYVNDSDGDTVFFNEFYDGSNKSLTIDKKISPKMGRGVMFNGLQYHASSSPMINSYRCVINIDFI